MKRDLNHYQFLPRRNGLPTNLHKDLNWWSVPSSLSSTCPVRSWKSGRWALHYGHLPNEDPKVPTSWKCAMRHVSIQVILQPLHGSAILQVGFQILFQSFKRKRRAKWWQRQISNTWRPFCRAICTRESAATPQRCPRLACAKAAAALKDGKQWWKGSQICWRY